MNAISLWEPWASMMAMGFKKNETRHWYTKYRGPLIIHAAKKILPKKDRGLLSIWCFETAGFSPFHYPMNYGHIVCMVDLVSCEKITEYNIPEDQIEQALGDYTPGRFMWKTANLKTFTPIPFKGSQGFFEIPNNIIANQKIHLTEKRK